MTRTRLPLPRRPGQSWASTLALASVAVLAVTGAPTSAAAQPGPVKVDLAVGTHAPISVGADLGVELPARLLARVHVGWMPPAYVDVINGTATSFGWYDETTANLVEAAIDQAFVLRASAGWRPIPQAGLEILAGYTLLLGTGSATTAETIEAATGQSFGRRVASDEAFAMEATIHAIHAELGWRFLFADDHVVFRLALGFVYGLAATVQLDADRGREAAEASEAYLEDILETYGFTPELKATLGYRF